MKKYALTGSHGTGKTTSVYKMAYDLKISNPNSNILIINEVARECPWDINLNSSKISQMWMFSKQIEVEKKMEVKCDIIVCDRTIVDYIAYSKFLGYDSLSDEMMCIAVDYISTYTSITLKDISTNNFCINDGVRDTKNTLFREGVHKILIDLYKELGVEFNHGGV